MRQNSILIFYINAFRKKNKFTKFDIDSGFACE